MGDSHRHSVALGRNIQLLRAAHVRPDDGLPGVFAAVGPLDEMAG
ncbi:hypothetical protein VC279_02330 [Xanthomonas sp. WHRI 10064A]|nr:hypothetical protein [Xanthomonas sp. WHRI 10064A]MEA9588623.1 hypothetical protein [Xanthomonas sp. WHRI 10064B]MEA9613608.1 hypothetical protein [Xanthomonas sp. WHRI 10064A]